MTTVHIINSRLKSIYIPAMISTPGVYFKGYLNMHTTYNNKIYFINEVNATSKFKIDILYVLHMHLSSIMTYMYL